MDGTEPNRSISTPVIVALVAAVGTGLVGTIIMTAGWIAGRLPTPLLIAVAVVVGVVAGVVSQSRAR